MGMTERMTFSIIRKASIFAIQLKRDEDVLSYVNILRSYYSSSCNKTLSKSIHIDLPYEYYIS